jgi:hypothetical protein
MLGFSFMSLKRVPITAIGRPGFKVMIRSSRGMLPSAANATVLRVTVLNRASPPFVCGKHADLRSISQEGAIQIILLRTDAFELSLQNALHLRPLLHQSTLVYMGVLSLEVLFLRQVSLKHRQGCDFCALYRATNCFLGISTPANNNSSLSERAAPESAHLQACKACFECLSVHIAEVL